MKKAFHLYIELLKTDDIRMKNDPLRGSTSSFNFFFNLLIENRKIIKPREYWSKYNTPLTIDSYLGLKFYGETLVLRLKSHEALLLLLPHTHEFLQPLLLPLLLAQFLSLTEKRHGFPLLQLRVKGVVSKFWNFLYYWSYLTEIFAQDVKTTKKTHFLFLKTFPFRA